MPVASWLLQENNPNENIGNALGGVAQQFESEIFAPTIRAREQLFNELAMLNQNEKIRNMQATPEQIAFGKKFGYDIKTRGGYMDFLTVAPHEVSSQYRLYSTLFGGGKGRKLEVSDYLKMAQAKTQAVENQYFEKKPSEGALIRPYIFGKSLHESLDKPSEQFPILDFFMQSMNQATNDIMFKENIRDKNEIFRRLTIRAKEFPRLYDAWRNSPENAGRTDLPKSFNDWNVSQISGQDGRIAHGAWQALASIEPKWASTIPAIGNLVEPFPQRTTEYMLGSGTD